MTEYVGAPYPDSVSRRQLNPGPAIFSSSTPSSIVTDTKKSSSVYKSTPTMPWRVIGSVVIGAVLVVIAWMVIRRYQNRKKPVKEDLYTHNQSGMSAQSQPSASMDLPMSQWSNNTDEIGQGCRHTWLPGRHHRATWRTVNDMINYPRSYPFMLMVYADWCGACKRAMPAYNMAGEQAKGSLFFSIEASEIPKDAQLEHTWMEQVTGYPTFFIFRQNKPVPSIYKGERTPEAFIRAVEA